MLRCQWILVERYTEFILGHGIGEIYRWYHAVVITTQAYVGAAFGWFGASVNLLAATTISVSRACIADANAQFVEVDEAVNRDESTGTIALRRDNCVCTAATTCYGTSA